MCDHLRTFLVTESGRAGGADIALYVGDPGNPVYTQRSEVAHTYKTMYAPPANVNTVNSTNITAPCSVKT
jgi:hypothetical protein